MQTCKVGILYKRHDVVAQSDLCKFEGDNNFKNNFLINKL